MIRIAIFAAGLAALFLSGCAGGPGVGQCAGSSVCPLLIYEKYPGVFGVYPDYIDVQRDAATGKRTLIWTFADQDKYKFSARTDLPQGDGVEFIGTSGAVIGVKPCFITSNSRDSLSYASEGLYYRCEIAIKGDLPRTPYRIRFRTKDGSPRVVDPYVGSTGGGDTVARAVAPFATLAVSVGTSGVLPPLGAYEGVKVIWDAGATGSFKEASGDGVVLVDASSGATLQPCVLSDASGGSPASASASQYFMCVVFAAGRPLKFNYTATFTDTSGARTASGMLTRP